MRFVRIAGSNLNSLYGPFHVDLENDLRDAPIFLIVGPTGAGKSTLMDAISLALFGQTPRLANTRKKGDEAGVADLDARHVMSRGTGECFAEVEFTRFENGQTVRYRARWQCHRARKKPGGSFQPAWRTLSRFDAATGAWGDPVGGDKRKDFEPAFERVLEGINVGEFQRCVLLAQGEFAAFLRADEATRAAILERLTDSSIYQTLGARTANRFRDAKARLDALRARGEAVGVATDDERRAMQDRLVATARARVELEGTRERLRGHHRWLEHARVVESRVAEVAETDRIAREGWDAAASVIAQLEAHERAERAAAAGANRDRIAIERTERAASLRSAQSQLDRALVEAATVQPVLAAAQFSRDAAERATTEARDDIAAARGVRATLASTQRARAVAAAEIDRATQTLGVSERAFDEWTARAAARSTRAAEASSALQRTAATTSGGADALALLRASDVEALRDGAKTVRTRCDTRVRALDDADRCAVDIADTTERLAALEQARLEHIRSSESRRETLRSMHAMLPVSKARLDERAQALEHIRWAIGLARERQRLQPDDACPLCGSLSHPYRAHDEARDADAAIAAREKALLEALSIAQSAVDSANLQRDGLERQQVAADALEIARAAQRAEADERLAARTVQLRLAMDGAGLSSSAAAVERTALRVALQALMRAVDARVASVEEFETSERERVRAMEALAVARTAVAESQERHEPLVREEAELLVRAEGLLSGRDPDGVERELRETLSAAERAWQSALASDGAAGLGVATSRQDVQRFGEQLAALDATLKGAEAAFIAELVAAEIPNESALAARRLDETSRVASVSRRAELRERLDRARSVLAEAIAMRDAHVAARPQDLDPRVADSSSLAVELAALDASIARHIEDHTTTLAQITMDDDRRSRARETDRERAIAEAEFERWERLHVLIGKNDGDEFKRFAQTLNLQELLARANEQLAQLEPRYALVPALGANDQPRLTFAVRDAWHAGEERPVATLSGGETFLVSLALALALASYRTVRLPIETILLDEGFGTLDTDTLQVVMRALESLHARGMQVGIISHVEALRERIPARVIVQKQGSGRSTVRVEYDG